MLEGGLGFTTHSPETRLQISRSLTGKVLPQEVKDKLSKKVCQYDLNGNFIKIFRSESEALISIHKKFGISSSIHRKQSAGGYQWRYVSANYLENIGRYTRRLATAGKRGAYKKKILIKHL